MTTPARCIVAAATLALFLFLENGNHAVVSASSSRAAASHPWLIKQQRPSWRLFLNQNNERDEESSSTTTTTLDEEEGDPTGKKNPATTLVQTVGPSITVEDHYWFNTAAPAAVAAAMREQSPFGWGNDASSERSDGTTPNSPAGDPIPDASSSSSPPSSSKTTSSSEDEETAAVGVKSHHHPSKKSNAVGDPDGEGSDSEDDDDDDDEEEWQELEEELLEEMESLMQQQQQLNAPPPENTENDLTTTHQVEVEVEFVDEDNNKSDEIIDMDETSSPSRAMADSTLGEETTVAAASATKSSLGSGGVGVRSLGQRLGRHRRHHKTQSELQPEEELSAESSSSQSTRSSALDEKKTATTPSLSVQEQQMLDAWLPHVFLPPSTAALDYLKSHARAMDGASKLRLDRRTLYAGLLMEWNRLQDASSSSSSNTNNNKKGNTSRASHRKFLEKSTGQALQAALALATQPRWRRSFTRPNGLRLYDTTTTTTPATSTRNNNDRNNNESPSSTTNHRACTLAMQETIAMALVR